MSALTPNAAKRDEAIPDPVVDVGLGCLRQLSWADGGPPVSAISPDTTLPRPCECPPPSSCSAKAEHPRLFLPRKAWMLATSASMTAGGGPPTDDLTLP